MILSTTWAVWAEIYARMPETCNFLRTQANMEFRVSRSGRIFACYLELSCGDSNAAFRSQVNLAATVQRIRKCGRYSASDLLSRSCPSLLACLHTSCAQTIYSTQNNFSKPQPYTLSIRSPPRLGRSQAQYHPHQSRFPKTRQS